MVQTQRDLGCGFEIAVRALGLGEGLKSARCTQYARDTIHHLDLIEGQSRLRAGRAQDALCRSGVEREARARCHAV
ncbi:hypothetical protein AB0436_08460 [Streptomyces sp. NPDC051322]|uniref:hypothetical protein n=1 Tax=Streptomyces sp. NPDC051322 TaxID=3154645 RepID=UPI00344B224E